MKTKYIFSTLVFSIMLTLFSCGPSAEEIAAKEKSKMDSIAKVTEVNTRLQIEKEKALQDSIAQAEASAAMNKEMQEANTANLKQSLSDANTELRLAKEKLSRIKEFTFGRTASEKEQQITQQYKIIQTWEDEMERLKGELNK